MNLISFLFQQKGVKQFLNNIRSRGNRSQPSGFSYGFYHLTVFVLHVFYRIFHCRKQCCLSKSWRRRGFSFPDIHLHLFKLHTLTDFRKGLIFHITGGLILILTVHLLYLTESFVYHDFSSGNELFSSTLCINNCLFVSARRTERT